MSDPPRRRRRNNTTADATSLATKVVTTAVVAYGAYRLADWAWNAWNSNNSRNDTRQSTSVRHAGAAYHQHASGNNRRRRQQRVARCQRECWQAWQALGGSTTLSPLLTPPTDTTELTRRLKELRSAADADDTGKEEQTALWHDVKIRSVTRWIVTAYAQALLMLVLTVQTNLWGAQLWQEQQSQPEHELASTQSSTQRMQTYQQEHQAVLQQTFGTFFSTGLPALIECVARATEHVLRDWNVTDAAYLHVTPQRLAEAVDAIRHIVEERHAKRRRTLWRFFVPAVGAATADESDILAETWDWLESPLLQDALEDTMRVTFAHAQQVAAQLCWPADASAECSLAQLLPKLKKNAAKLLASVDNPLLERVQQLPSVQEIGNLCFR